MCCVGESKLRPLVTRKALALMVIHGVTKQGAVMANAVSSPQWYHEVVPLFPLECVALHRVLQIVAHANSFVR